MVELPVVVRVVDDSCLIAPNGSGSAAVKVGGIVHSEELADSCSLPDSCSFTLLLETSVYHYKVNISLLVCSESSTWMSSVIELS